MVVSGSVHAPGPVVIGVVGYGSSETDTGGVVIGTVVLGILTSVIGVSHFAEWVILLPDTEIYCAMASLRIGSERLITGLSPTKIPYDLPSGRVFPSFTSAT